jgi:hypothetical protein
MTETPPDGDLEADVPEGTQSEVGTETSDSGEATDVDTALAEADLDDERFTRGDALTPSEAAQLAATSRATVVVFAGDTGAGKTTIMASLYERLGRGPVAGRLFAGSRTLPGLELRCWGGRVNSGLLEPRMPHTAREALPWLHVRLRAADLSAPFQDLLLGDFFGERFRDLIAGTRTFEDFPFLRRADHVCLTLDGQRLAEPVPRNAEIQLARDLLDVLLEGELASPAVLSVVVTKLDMVMRAGQEAQATVDKVTSEIVERVRSVFPDTEIPVIPVAARSTISELPLGHGLEELVELFARQPALQISHPPRMDELGTPATAFDRYRA